MSKTNDPEIIALARAVYEGQRSPYDRKWATDLTTADKHDLCMQAVRIADGLDALGYRLAFIPPEG